MGKGAVEPLAYVGIVLGATKLRIGTGDNKKGGLEIRSRHENPDICPALDVYCHGGEFSPTTISRIIKYLNKIKEEESRWEKRTQVEAIAASVGRDALNFSDFQEEVYERTGGSKNGGIVFRKITGEQEGALEYAAVRSELSSGMQDKVIGVIGLGGGSGHFVIGGKDGITAGMNKAYKIGAIALPAMHRRAYQTPTVLAAATEFYMKQRCAHGIAEMKACLEKNGLEVAAFYISGGYGRAVAKVCAKWFDEESAEVIRRDRLDRAAYKLVDLSPEELNEKFDVKLSRGESLPHAAIILKTAFKLLSLDTARVARTGLRKALLLSMHQKALGTAVNLQSA